MIQQEVLQNGTFIYNGKYRIEGVIEQGGLGITYKATLVQLDAPITIKELFLAGKCVREDDNSIALQSFSERRFTKFKHKFVEEGRGLAKFKHPNLVQIRDIVEENNTVYLIMDYVEEQTLKDYIQQKGALSEEEALSYALQIGSALQEIHSKGFLHKDVRPSNVLITSDGRVVLVGLGVTGQFVSAQTQASASPNYAPMEQYIAQYTKKDTSGPYTDVYALAATLYYCLTGQEPLSAVERQREELLPPQSINSTISTKINSALVKAMSVRADERHQNIDDFIKAIRPVDFNNVPDALKKGTRLQNNKYRIESIIGQGGLGITYQATLLKLDMTVVIKELFLPGYNVRQSDKTLALHSLPEKQFGSYKKKFIQEAKILAKTNHPHIVQVKDSFSENNTVYLVMEHVSGRNLHDIVSKKGKLSEEQSLIYIRQIASALDEVHAKGFLHKDVRPSNIRINKQGKAVLVGLGVEKDKVKSNADPKEAGYSPMEQYASQSKLGTHTDVYALGATLYHLVTGERPISAFDRQYTSLPAPQEKNKELTRRTSRAIVKAMNNKEAERYPTVAEFMDDLAYIDPAIIRKRNIRRVLAVAASLVAFVLAFLLITREPPPPTIAAKDFDRFKVIANNIAKKGDYKKAERYYEGLLQIRPNDEALLEAKKHAEKAQNISMEWWNNLDNEWKSVFRKSRNFVGRPNKDDLRGIYNLRELYCYDTQIQSLEPIKDLLNLEVLGCYNTPIKDLSPLADLSNLQQLDCSSTKIKTLEPIKNLPNLLVLDCSKTDVTTLEPVRDTPKLKELYCSNTRVTTIDPVRDLPQLDKLYCAKTAVKDLEPASELDNLKELYVYNTPIENLESVKNLKNLHTLHCYKTHIKTLEPIKDLTNLHTLHAYNTQITNLNPIASLENIKNLYVYSTAIETLEPLQNLKNLTDLKCYNTRIETIEPLANLSNLQSLHFSKTAVADLSPLSNLENLTTLHCSSTQIENLKPLASLPNLSKLHCSSTQINSLEPLEKLDNVKELYCANVQINNLHPLKNLQNLTVLDCSSTQINSLDALANLQNLKELNISGTSVNNLGALSKLANLEVLKSSSTNLSAEQLAEFKKKRENVVIE